MKYEKSCGAVVFTRIGGQIQYVLAQGLGGHYGFPKGHMEPGETEEDTALREILEEVHLRPVLIPGFYQVIEYDIPNTMIHKRVAFFLAEYSDQLVQFQREELKSAPVVPFEEAMSLLTHPESRDVLAKANAFLCRRSS